MSTKPTLHRLKANVVTQESRLKEGIRMLNAAKRKEQPKSMPSGSYSQQASKTSEWDPLERVIRQMDDLLISYKKYSSELERRLKQLERKGGKKRKP